MSGGSRSVTLDGAMMAFSPVFARLNLTTTRKAIEMFMVLRGPLRLSWLPLQDASTLCASQLKRRGLRSVCSTIWM